MAQNLIVEDKEAHLSCYTSTKNRNAKQGNTKGLLLLLVCVSFTIIGQPRNSVLIRRV